MIRTIFILLLFSLAVLAEQPKQIELENFPSELHYTAVLPDLSKLTTHKKHKVKISYYIQGGTNALFVESFNKVPILNNKINLDLGKGSLKNKWFHKKGLYSSLQKLFAYNREVEMQINIDGINLYPKIGILPAGHSQKSGLLLKGAHTNDKALHWKGYNRPSAVSSFRAVKLSADKTTLVNTKARRTNPYEIKMNGPFLSIPVRDMALATQSDTVFQEKEINSLRHEDLFDKNGFRYGTKSPKQVDALAEKSKQNPGGFFTPVTNLDFPGMGNSSGVYPPDIEGAVGVNYYVQMVNSTFEIYNKSDGSVAQAARNTNTLWSSHGGRCQSDNSGDAIALYDEQAGRWVLTQFAVAAAPEAVCFAISVTGDPTGAYYTYDLATARFPDYYKLGVWPAAGQNAYFMGTNSGQQNQYDVYAIDRENMLLGLAARPAQFFQSFPNLLMPADNDGDNPPPANAPGLLYTIRDAGEPYFGNPANDSIDVYEFDVDWGVPSSSAFNLVQVITNADGLSDFNWTVCGFFVSNCIPQQGTSVLIDSNSWWPQQRLQYRNFGGFETLVGVWGVNAVVAPAKHTAPRWFELRRNIGAGSWGLRQEGTFAPDSDHRFSPSISMDASENIALGYSVTSSTSFPSIRYTIHDASVDPLGTMEPEVTMVNGGGSQTGSAGRWGDYSSMDVDPVDDCTFWFTTEYYTTTSQVNWVTRIGSFKVPTCKNYLVTAVNDNIKVCKADDTASFSLSLSTDFNATTNMTLSGCPTGASCSFSPNPVVNPASTTALNLSSLTGATGGSHAMTATATDSVDSLATNSIDLTLFLFDGNPGTPVLSSPASSSFAASLGPNLNWSAVTDGQDYLVEVDNDPAFGSVDFSTTVNGGLTTATSSGLSENMCYYWRVSPSNLCGTGTTSSVFNFYTGAAQTTATFPSTDVPLTIATVPVSVPSTLTIAGVGVINDVNVIGIDITHTYVGDLTLTLKSPAGTVVTIMNVGCGTDNDINISLDDEAAGTWGCAGTGPIGGGGTFQPSNALSAFDGEDANGVWTLTVVDGFNGDGGSLNGWGLNFVNFADTGNYCGVAPTYTIGGSVSGLVGSGLVLQNNLGDNLSIAGNGNFTFSTPLVDLAGYSVTVLTQPSSPSQVCNVTNASGTLAGANVTNVSVSCSNLPDISFSGTNLNQDVCLNPGPTAITPVTLTTTALNGFNNVVTLAFNPVLPTGISGGFSNNNFVPAASPGTDSLLNLTVDNTATAGLNTITVQASGTGISTKSVAVALNVIFGLSSSPVATTPTNGSTGVAVGTSFSWNAISGALSYDIDIATDPGFLSIVASANVATNSYTPGAALNNATVYYWRVRAANSCGNTAYTVSAFETVAGSGVTTTTYCSAANLNVAITDNDPAGVNNAFNIATSGTITDINISLDVSHTWVGDLIANVQNNSTTTNVTVLDRPGYTGSGNGCSRNNINTTLDDAAGTPVEGVCPNATPTIGAGPFSPNNPLSVFNTETINGAWTLNISDNANADTGTLNQWCVIATVDTGTSLPPADYSDLNSSYGVAKHEGGGVFKLGSNWTADSTFSQDSDVADDDGVSASGDWSVGSATAVLSVTPNVAGFVSCWFDWNNDGSFASGERTINQSISAGATNIPIAIPGTSTFGSNSDAFLETRCRFYNSVQAKAPSSPVGSAAAGEVEDYRLPAATLTPVTLAYSSSFLSSNTFSLDWSTTTEAGTIGFNIYGFEKNVWVKLNTQPIKAKGINSVIPHDYHFNLGKNTINTYKIEELTMHGKTIMYGPYTSNLSYGLYPQTKSINWGNIKSQSSTNKVDRLRAIKTTPNFIKTLVNVTGAQRVTYENLLAQGVDWQGVNASEIALTFENKPIARKVSDDVFGPGSTIDFIGTAADTLYTRTNIYELKLNNALVKNIISEKATDYFVDVFAYYMAESKFDEDVKYTFAALGSSPWFNSSLLAFTTQKDFAFSLDLPHIIDNGINATFNYFSWGGTDWPQNTDHHLQAFINNVLVSDRLSNGLAHINDSVSLDYNQVLASNNIVFRLPADTGVDYDLIQLDKFNIQYPAELYSDNDVLEFIPITNNSSVNTGPIFKDGFEISSVKSSFIQGAPTTGFIAKGFSSADISAYAFDGNNLYDFPQANIQLNSNGYDISLPNVSKASVRYYLSTNASIHQPILEPAITSNLYLDQNIDYLIISHPDFVQTINQLADYHRSKGINVLVVDVDDIYSNYSHHRIDPHAIKTFIKDATIQSGIKSVLLVGSDSYDYFDNLGIGSISFIPTLYHRTGDIVQYAPVDALFADINDDLIPDIAVGRLPVRTTPELQNSINKIIGFDARNYQNTAVFASDRNPVFDAYSDQMGQLLPQNWQLNKAYINDLELLGAQSSLINNINSGVTLTSFFGHSGPSTWSFEHLFDSADILSLNNSGMPTVVNQFGCWNTYYVMPEFNTMAHNFMSLDNKGAVAVLGAGTLTQSDHESELGLLLMSKITQTNTTIGQATLEAKKQLAKTHPEYLDVILGWSLLGDPLTIINNP